MKKLEFVDEDSNLLSKRAKPNFKTLGPKYGNRVNEVCTQIKELSPQQIKVLEQKEKILLNTGDIILFEDVDVVSEEITGYSVSINDSFSVALDVSLSEKLKEEGLAREFVNRIQSLRKEKGFLVTDKICLSLEKNDKLELAINNNLEYICNETLTDELHFSSQTINGNDEITLVDNVICNVLIYKK